MKILRMSLYESPFPSDAPHHTIVDVEQLNKSVEEAIEEMRTDERLDGYIAHEVFDVDPADPEIEIHASRETMMEVGAETLRLIRITQVAMRLHEAALPRELNCAMLYHYDAGMFAQVKTGGSVIGTVPTPLSAEEIKDVFLQLAARSDYRGFTLQTISEDGEVVRLLPPNHVVVEGRHGLN